MRWLFCEQAEPLTALYAVMTEPTPALTASANGHRYNSWSVRSSGSYQSSYLSTSGSKTYQCWSYTQAERGCTCGTFPARCLSSALLSQ